MTPARFVRAGALGCTLAATALLVAGCTSTTGGTGSPASVAPTTSASVTTSAAPSTSATPAPTTPAPTTSAPRSSAAAPRTTAAPPTPTPTPTPVISASPSTCLSVGVRAVQGGAERGAEIAALQFTNTGTIACRLGDFPAVTLLRNGRVVGSPSQPGTTAPRTLTLKPGDTVESLLRDFSSCQAPLSDSARITVPGESLTVVRPIQLRACTLRVGPLGPPA